GEGDASSDDSLAVAGDDAATSSDMIANAGIDPVAEVMAAEASTAQEDTTAPVATVTTAPADTPVAPVSAETADASADTAASQVPAQMSTPAVPDVAAPAAEPQQ